MEDRMAEMNRLEAYLSLERAMLQLDAAGDAFADSLREVMDPLWYELSDEDRDFLNARRIPQSISELEPLHGRLDVASPPHEVEEYKERGPLQVDWEWKRAA
jgi:hypothetical protein